MCNQTSNTTKCIYFLKRWKELQKCCCDDFIPQYGKARPFLTYNILIQIRGNKTKWPFTHFSNSFYINSYKVFCFFFFTFHV